MRGLVRSHDFTILWVGQTVSELGNRMSVFVLPIAAWQVSHSALATALAGAAAMTGDVLALLPGGILADRLNGRRVMRSASAIGGLAFASLVVAGALGHLTVIHLIAVGLIGGASAGVFAPVESAAIRVVVPTEQVPAALSQNQAREHVASLVGGPLGGVLIAIARWLPFAADALSYLVSWLMLGRLRTDLTPPRREPTRVRDELREGFAFIWERRFFRVLLVWAALTNLALNALFFAALLRLIEGGYRPATIGLTEAAAGIAGILGAIAAPWLIRRFATGRLTVTLGWSSIPLSIPLIWFNNPIAFVIAIGGTMLLNPAGNAGIGAYRMHVTPAELQGRVVAASRFAATIVMPLAPVSAGLLLSALGGPAAITVLLVASALTALLIAIPREVRQVPRPDQWDQANTERSVPVQASRTSSSETLNAPSTVSAEPPVEPNTVDGMPSSVAANSSAST